MLTANVRVPHPKNEPILSYAPGTPERAEVQAALRRMEGERVEIPVVIGGKRLMTGNTDTVRMPHRHQHVLGTVHQADASHVAQAIEAALKAKEEWSRTSFQERAAIFLRAAELLATRYRPILNAATMLGQAKTVYQAEIDSACEAIDFLLQQAGMEGRVMIEFVIDTLGRAERNSMRVVNSFHPLAEAPARETVVSCRFRPGRIQGRAVRVRVQIPINFTMAR